MARCLAILAIAWVITGRQVFYYLIFQLITKFQTITSVASLGYTGFSRFRPGLVWLVWLALVGVCWLEPVGPGWPQLVLMCPSSPQAHHGRSKPQVGLGWQRLAPVGSD